MAKSLLATFPSSDTFSQQFSGEIAAKFLAVLEAVSELSRPAKTDQLQHLAKLSCNSQFEQTSFPFCKAVRDDG
jgi:hypothetical protein